MPYACTDRMKNDIWTMSINSQIIHEQLGRFASLVNEVLWFELFLLGWTTSMNFCTCFVQILHYRWKFMSIIRLHCYLITMQPWNEHLYMRTSAQLVRACALCTRPRIWLSLKTPWNGLTSAVCMYVYAHISCRVKLSVSLSKNAIRFLYRGIDFE